MESKLSNELRREKSDTRRWSVGIAVGLASFAFVAGVAIGMHPYSNQAAIDAESQPACPTEVLLCGCKGGKTEKGDDGCPKCSCPTPPHLSIEIIPEPPLCPAPACFCRKDEVADVIPQKGGCETCTCTPSVCVTCKNRKLRKTDQKSMWKKACRKCKKIQGQRSRCESKEKWTENKKKWCCKQFSICYDDADKIQEEPPVLVVGGCAGTRFGCCPDDKTSKESNDDKCNGKAPLPLIAIDPLPELPPPEEFPMLGGCGSTRFGCCPDGKGSKVSADDKCDGKTLAIDPMEIAPPIPEVLPAPEPGLLDIIAAKKACATCKQGKKTDFFTIVACGKCKAATKDAYPTDPKKKCAAAAYAKEHFEFCCKQNNGEGCPKEEESPSKKPGLLDMGVVTKACATCNQGKKDIPTLLACRKCQAAKEEVADTAPPPIVGGCQSTRFGCCDDGEGYKNFAEDDCKAKEEVRAEVIVAPSDALCPIVKCECDNPLLGKNAANCEICTCPEPPDVPVLELAPFTPPCAAPYCMCKEGETPKTDKDDSGCETCNCVPSEPSGQCVAKEASKGKYGEVCPEKSAVECKKAYADHCSWQ